MTTIPPVPRGEVGRNLTKIGVPPAAVLFAAIWIGAALILVLTGHSFPLASLLKVFVCLVLSALTIAITQPAPEDTRLKPGIPLLLLQTVLVMLFILLTAWSGLVYHGVVAPDATIPLWSPLVQWLRGLGEQWFGNGNWVANPVTYVVLPLLVLLLLARARLSTLGFARGHRVGRVLLLWSAIPVVLFIYVLITGQLTLGLLAAIFVSHFLSNGFSEEFLFRGALQTRLRRFWGPSWAVVAQAIVFGAWHLGLGYTVTGHDGFLPALASTIINQAVLGLAFGVVYERTRNLIAPTVVHILVNSVG